jgi:hypothetical protein
MSRARASRRSSSAIRRAESRQGITMPAAFLPMFSPARSGRRILKLGQPMCFGTEPGPHPEWRQLIGMEDKYGQRVGSRSVPIGTPPMPEFSRRIEMLAQIRRGSRFAAETQRAVQ